MEENLDTSPPRSPVKARRRSSFFERRQSMSVLPLTEVVPASDEMTGRPSQNQRLEDYTELLTNEKAAWKTFYTEKKKEYEECFKCLKTSKTSIVSADTLYDLLREEEKEFLESKPNLKEVWSECNDACNRARDLLTLATNLCAIGLRAAQNFES